MKNELIETDNLQLIVDRYKALVTNLQVVEKAIVKYNAVANMIYEYLSINEDIKRAFGNDSLIMQINQRFILECLQYDKLRKIFSAKQLDKIYKDTEKLAKNENFEISMETATGIIDSILLNSESLLTEQLKSCYMILTNSYNPSKFEHYKTLGGWKINKKSKIYADESNINDVISCFNLLADTKCKDTYSKYEHLKYDHDTRKYVPFKNFECDFFTAKLYKNEYAHLTFKNQELVDKFNQKVGSLFNWLPY